MTATATTRPNQIQEPETPSESPTLISGAWALGPPSTVSPGPLARSWYGSARGSTFIGSSATRPWTVAQIGFWHHRQWLNIVPQCQLKYLFVPYLQILTDMVLLDTHELCPFPWSNTCCLHWLPSGGFVCSNRPSLSSRRALCFQSECICHLSTYGWLSQPFSPHINTTLNNTGRSRCYVTLASPRSSEHFQIWEEIPSRISQVRPCICTQCICRAILTNAAGRATSSHPQKADHSQGKFYQVIPMCSSLALWQERGTHTGKTFKEKCEMLWHWVLAAQSQSAPSIMLESDAFQ